MGELYISDEVRIDYAGYRHWQLEMASYDLVEELFLKTRTADEYISDIFERGFTAEENGYALRALDAKLRADNYGGEYLHNDVLWSD